MYTVMMYVLLHKHMLCCVSFMVVNGVRSISVWLNGPLSLSLLPQSPRHSQRDDDGECVCVCGGGGVTVCLCICVCVCVMLDRVYCFVRVLCLICACLTYLVQPGHVQKRILTSPLA